MYDHFGGATTFPDVSLEMMEAVDRADAAQLTIEDIVDPRGWILLSFLMDPRTGLGRFRDFRISNYQLMMQLIDSCLNLSIEEILASPDVAERVALYREHADARVHRLDPRAVGPAPAEHRVRGGAVDPGPLLARGHRRADAGPWRRRLPKGGNRHHGGVQD